MKQELGYTLVEIVLAIAILGLVLVPLSMFMSNSSGIITHAYIRETAVLIAQQKMETIKSKGYNKVLGGNYNYNIEDPKFPEYDFNRYPDYNLTENVIVRKKNLKEIEIIISWNDNKKVILKSNIAKR